MAKGFRPTARQLRHRIELQSLAVTPDATDDFTKAYTTVATVWARIDTIAGGRLIDGVQDQERVTHRFIIRYRKDQADWRWIKFDGRLFEVRTVMNQGELKEFLEIMAEEES